MGEAVVWRDEACGVRLASHLDQSRGDTFGELHIGRGHSLVALGLVDPFQRLTFERDAMHDAAMSLIIILGVMPS